MLFATRTYCCTAALFLLASLVPDPAHSQSPNLRSPSEVRGFYTNLPGNQFGNATGAFVFIAWKGDSSEADPTWGGYRVRRTIFGVSPQRLEVQGQWKARHIQGPICWQQISPCFPATYEFTGTGLFFHGFRENRRVVGTDTTYVIPYPPGAPQDTCSNCWIFADGSSLAGFAHEYAVTAIDTTVVIGSDFYETPIDSAEIVRITPGSLPPDNLERVAVVPNPYKIRAEWDPTPGQHEIHFIRVPHESTIRIFTAAGELLRTLQSNQYASPGGLTGDVTWDLRNDRGRGVVSGIYIYQVETKDGRTRKGKFVIIK